ncbi:MAG: prepilin-type N-terminal cleavage/methylation domain-containing protein [Candidatus Electrothrix sp. AR4]|nr:prepilin-type N-terminal cleavage/methylation domain-containing protein [Candidatus Electrothrix sp. AR4]
MMKQSAIDAKDTSGFSFMELMIVIALIGILSAISVPNFLKNLPEKRLKNAARNLYADMQKVRLLAVKGNRNIALRFNIDDAYYYIDKDKKDETGYKVWNADESRRDLSDYGGIAFGKGAAKKNWNKSEINSVVPINDINFKLIGTATPASVYLQNQDQNISYAITTTNYGTVKLRRFSGTSWE